MAKLVDLLAKHLKEWPDGATHAVVDKDCRGKSKVSFTTGGAPEWRESLRDWTVLGGCPLEVEWLIDHEMDSHGLVAAPHQIVTKSEYLAARDRLHADTLKDMRKSTNADADQALWDKVALQTHEALFRTQDGKAMGFDERAEFSFNEADAFMAERAKRLKGGV